MSKQKINRMSPLPEWLLLLIYWKNESSENSLFIASQNKKLRSLCTAVRSSKYNCLNYASQNAKESTVTGFGNRHSVVRNDGCGSGSGLRGSGVSAGVVKMGQIWEMATLHKFYQQLRITINTPNGN